MESSESYDYDVSIETSEDESTSASEGFEDDDEESYGEESSFSEDDDPTGDSDDDKPVTKTAAKKEIIKRSKISQKGKEQEVPNLEDLTEKILKSKRFDKLNKLEELTKGYGLDVKLVIKAEGVRRKPLKKDYIKILLSPEAYGYSRHERQFVDDSVEDAGEDAEDTAIPSKDEDIHWVRDKKRYKISQTEQDLVRKGLIDRESLYYYEWTDSRKAKRPQKETITGGSSFSFTDYIPNPGSHYTYTPSIRVSRGPTKMIGDEPVHGRTIPLELKPGSSKKGPPPGYESFHIGERVSFLGEEVYRGFLTRADGPRFYISGFSEPFYYEKIDGYIPTAISAPESSLILSTQDEEFKEHLAVIYEKWPQQADAYNDQTLGDMFAEKDPSIPTIVGIGLDRGQYSWIYDFTMDPSRSDMKQLIPVAWGNHQRNYNSITQYVSVVISGIVEGTVIGYSRDKMRILTDQGEKVNISLGEPSLKIIPGRGDRTNPSIPTKKDILCSGVTPDIRLAVVDKLFNNFANIIPGLIDQKKEAVEEEKENVSLPFISVFRTWDEYFMDQFHMWLKAKYLPEIIANLPYDELKHRAYRKATMGLGEDDLDAIHNRWGLDLVNSLDENYKKRLIEWKVSENNPKSFFHLTSDNMLKYLQDSKNKTIFEIEIERGLYDYQPYQPPRLSEGFKLAGGHYLKSTREWEGELDPYATEESVKDPEQFDVISVGGKQISTGEVGRKQDPRVTEMLEKTQLAVALTRMIRSFMIKFPLNKDKIYKELVDEEIERRYNKLVPLGKEPARSEEATSRLMSDLDEFSAMHGKNIRELYIKYEEEWNTKLDNPNGNVEKIIERETVREHYKDKLEILRSREIELTQDPNDPGKMRPEYGLSPETKRLLDIIKGDREILERDIFEISQDIETLGSSSRTVPLTIKGHAVRSEIKQFERNCLVVSKEKDIGDSIPKDTTENYLRIVLYPLIFISVFSRVSDYSRVFKSKIADRTYPVDSLLNANLFNYFPEFYMKDNNDDIKTRGKEAILDVNKNITMKFVQDFINAKYLGPRRVETRPEKVELGFDWQSATISPQKVCEEQTNSGRTLARVKYEEQYYKKLETEKIPMERGLLEKRIVTETEMPLYKIIEDGNLIIDQNPETKRFTCHSKPEIILQIAATLKKNPGAKVIMDPRTNNPYSDNFIDRMKERYQKEIDQTMRDLPANFVLNPTPKQPRIVSENIYYKSTGEKFEPEEDEKGVIIEPKPWEDLKSFSRYIKRKGKVLVLFCSPTSPTCTDFKANVWPRLASKYSNVTFLDIDTQDTTYGGSDIAVEYKSKFAKGNQLVMKPSIFLFVGGNPIGRSKIQKDEAIKLIDEYKEEEEVESEEVESEEVESEEVESEEETDLPLWTNLSSFIDYVKPKGKVLVLFCDTSSACTKFKASVWSNLGSRYQDITFLDIDINDKSLGTPVIAKNFNLIKGAQTKTVPNIVMIINGIFKGRAPPKQMQGLIDYKRKK
jgi:hypothetical protein